MSSRNELIFALSVSSFTEKGYVASASFDDKPIEIEFDDADSGVFLTPEMLKRLGATDGSKLLLVVESEGEPQVTESEVSRAASRPRISSTKVYYEVGREGGAVLRIKKA